MKRFYLKYILPAIMIIVATGLQGQTSSQNYVMSRSYTIADGSLYLDEIQYLDGLGRQVETVQKEITPAKADLVTYLEYDAFGNKYRMWLPAIAAGNNGAYMTQAAFTAKSVATYRNSVHNSEADYSPYSEILYEKSPLKRVLKQYAPGDSWVGDDYYTGTDYYLNAGTSGNFACIKFKVTGTGMNTKLERTGHYGDGMLYVTRIRDENGNYSDEFKNKLGQVVLTRATNNGQYLDTYFVYDTFGNLSYVLPPMAVDNLTDITDGGNTMKKYAYVYKYDKYRRCISKRLPDCYPVYFVYDKTGRLIFTQDGEQNLKGEWLYTIPDVFGRVVLTGTCKNTDISNANYNGRVVTAKFAAATSANFGYTITGLVSNLVSQVTYTVNFYDNYNFMAKGDFSKIPYDATQYNTRYGEQTDAAKHKGLLTGTVTLQLNGSATASYLYSTLHYDYKGQRVQAHSTNHLGGTDKEYTAYNFTGQPASVKTVHAVSGKTPQTQLYTYVYDHALRLTQTKHKLNSGTDVILAANTYDEPGRLKTNKKNNQANLTVTYRYNIRSWIKSITGPLFSQTLYYNDSYGGSNEQYNGNISAMSWTVQGETSPRGYAFSYDNLSRLTEANYLVNGSPNTNYKASYTYDKHGNITSLKRYGKTSSSAYGLTDNLIITYTGNQLLKVTDTGTNVTMPESADFKDYADTSPEYTFNRNGAMNKDLNKGITGIIYNSLNLPRELVVKNTNAVGKTYYTYSSSGKKLKTIHKTTSNMAYTPVLGSTSGDANYNVTKTTDYAGSIVYENGTLKRILVDGGYIEGGVYYFYLTDHLGNNRIVANASGTVIQKTHYYPFGAAFAEGTKAEQSKQPYKYGDKLLDDTHGLNVYDFEARYSDPALANRFWMVDPLAEKYYSISPYVYCANNPLKFIDPTGKMIWQLDRSGNIITEITKIDGQNIDFDRIEILNDKGIVTAQTDNFTLGSIEQMTVRYPNGKSAYNIFTLKNADNNAKNIFETIANPNSGTNVEWTYSTYKEKNGNILSQVSTSHSSLSESSGISLFDMHLEKERQLIQTTHNHPVSIVYPSGLGENELSKDLLFSKNVIDKTVEKFGNDASPKVYLYEYSTKKYHPYNPNTTLKDFPNAGPQF